VYRQGEIQRLTNLLRTADERERELWWGREKLGGLDIEIADLAKRIAELEARVESEKQDVEQLREGGLRPMLLELFGALERRTEKEERELFEITLVYDAAVAQINAARGNRKRTAARVDALSGAEQEVADALVAVAEHVAANPDAKGAFDSDIAARLGHIGDTAQSKLSGASSSAGGQVARERGLRMLIALREDTATSVLGALTMGDRGGRPVPRAELLEALDAAKVARADIGILRDSLHDPDHDGLTHFERLHRWSSLVVAAQRSLSRFVEEIYEVYALHPLSGRFAVVVFGALGAASEAPIDQERVFLAEYLREWTLALERFIFDIEVALP
jgi:hypothetical protein